jgi:hypothetical protein
VIKLAKLKSLATKENNPVLVHSPVSSEEISKRVKDCEAPTHHRLFNNVVISRFITGF